MTRASAGEAEDKALLSMKLKEETTKGPFASQTEKFESCYESSLHAMNHINSR